MDIIADLLTPERVVVNIEARSKKRALEILSELLARDQPDLSQSEAFNSMIQRERLGSTGVGGGVALPHGRVPGLKRSIGAFVKLGDAVDYGATDEQPVDMLFALLVPAEAAEDHLRILASLAGKFSQPEFCRGLRQARNSSALFNLLSTGLPPQERVTA